MSALTKKKYVYAETDNNYELPKENQMIVKVKSPRGNNLHDVVTSSNEEFIVTMPTKFRKTVWVKRGDYLIVESIEEGNKVKAEIVNILNKDHIRHLKNQGVWPKEFEAVPAEEDTTHTGGVPRDMLPPSDSEEENDEEEDETTIKNVNRNYLFNNVNKLPI